MMAPCRPLLFPQSRKVHKSIVDDEKGMQSWNQSCIDFASLYGKPRVARNGNNDEINSRWWKNSTEIPRTKCTQFPDMEIILVFFSVPGNCVQFNFLSWELRTI